MKRKMKSWRRKRRRKYPDTHPSVLTLIEDRGTLFLSNRDSVSLVSMCENPTLINKERSKVMRKRSLVFRARILAIEQRWNPELKEVSMESIRAQGTALSLKINLVKPKTTATQDLDLWELEKAYRKCAKIRRRNHAL